MKYKNQAMAWLNRNCETFTRYGPVQNYGLYFGRRIRVTDYSEWAKEYGCTAIENERRTLIEIGDLDFDRWANSVAISFYYDKTKPFKSQFLDSIRREDARN